MLLRESHASRLKTNPGNCASLSGETGEVVVWLTACWFTKCNTEREKKNCLDLSQPRRRKTLRVISDVTWKQQGASSNEFENKSARAASEQENYLDKFWQLWRRERLKQLNELRVKASWLWFGVLKKTLGGGEHLVVKGNEHKQRPRCAFSITKSWFWRAPPLCRVFNIW